MRLRVPAKDLRVGDYLIATKRTVTRGPSAGIGTPRGKVDLTVTRAGREPQRVTWNARTMIVVSRATDPRVWFHGSADSAGEPTGDPTPCEIGEHVDVEHGRCLLCGEWVI